MTHMLQLYLFKFLTQIIKIFSIYYEFKIKEKNTVILFHLIIQDKIVTAHFLRPA